MKRRSVAGREGGRKGSQEIVVENCLTAMVDRAITGAEANQAPSRSGGFARAAENITLKRLSVDLARWIFL